MKAINAIVTANPADPSLEGKRVVIKISNDCYEKMNVAFQAEIAEEPTQKARPYIPLKGSLKKLSQRQIRKNKRRAQR